VSSPIAGSELPIRRAEELLATLPGVVAVRIIANEAGAVDEIHVLTTADVAPKQTVRNIESALIAHLGVRVDHRKISVATTVEPQRPRPAAAPGAAGVAPATAGRPTPSGGIAELPGRRYYFEDVEVRRSRARGVTIRVTLRKGEETFVGETEGLETEQSRMELAARATLQAIANAEGGGRALGFNGIEVIDAFGREFVFVGVTGRFGRDAVLLTGTCEVRDSQETASALAVLDATNRWAAQGR
jgi:hypothetical protein